MKTTHYILVLTVLAILNILVYVWPMRVDMTADKRYSLSAPTKELLRKTESDIDVKLLLGGNLNASFLQLKSATERLLEEFEQYGDVHYTNISADELAELSKSGLKATVIHERQQGGQMVQTTIYPYAVIRYQGKETVVSLLTNTRGLSGEENINRSIEQLEFILAEGISGLTQTEARKVAFIEGHGELPEANVYDLSRSLANYFQVDRGVLTGDWRVLQDYEALIIADPQATFSEADKYQIDQYVMHGGRILWVLDGVMFSDDILSKEGYTPVIAKDLNLQDLLFRYGVRITPSLLQDLQCLPVPVDVSEDATQPNFQPMPWYYAPLLLTSEASPITRNLGQVSSTFCSGLEFVGGDDGLRKEVLLATSSASRAIGVPAEVDLSLIELDRNMFPHAYIPVAAAVEGSFPSLFTHRMTPEGIVAGEKITNSQMSRQIVVASGSVIRNEVQQNQVVPLGYDRYTGMQFANKDFLVNAVLYLTDNGGLIGLRSRQLTLRLLNDQRSREMRTMAQVVTIVVPLLLLATLGATFITIRKRKYSRL